MAGKTKEIYLAGANCREAWLAADKGIKIIAVEDLQQLAAMLSGEEKKIFFTAEEQAESCKKYELDFADVKGHWAAKEAIVIGGGGRTRAFNGGFARYRKKYAGEKNSGHPAADVQGRAAGNLYGLFPRRKIG